MNRCYDLCVTQKYGCYIACLPKKSNIKHFDIENYLVKENRFPCELLLEPFKDKYKESPVEWHDIMYNEFAFFMVSERLKNFLEERRTEHDSFEWINVKIRHENIVKDYYVIMFFKEFDVIDEQNTSYYLEGTRILVHCFAYEKAEKYSIFTLNRNKLWPCIPIGLSTTEKIKKEMQKEKFSNLKFEKCKTSVNGIVVK